MTKLSPSPDILIVGGGINGALLSLALQQTPYRTLLCDASDFQHKATPHFDARSIALNHASVRILSALGLWDGLAPNATPIQTIQITSQGQFGAANLQGKKQPLGFVVEMHYFYEALRPLLTEANLLTQTQLTAYDPKTGQVTLKKTNRAFELKPKIIVAADGTDSMLRKILKPKLKHKPYAHHALVANIGLHRAHQGLAIERFTPHGPIALLPLEGHRSSLVWCLPPERAQHYLKASPKQFLASLQTEVGYRLGRLTQVGQRMCFPLAQSSLTQVSHGNVVFIGNAAQTVHPVAGQGLNLGLRDIAHLTQCLAQGLNLEALNTYEQLRAPDRQAILNATDKLIQSFTHPNLGIRTLRSLALSAFGQTQCLEPTLIRYASGFGHMPSNLACGLAPTLSSEVSHGI